MAALVLLVTIWRWWRQFRYQRTIEGLVELSPTEFEHTIARLLKKQGFRDVRRTGGAGDLNADIVGYDPRGRSVVVQCKRYRPGKGIGSEAIQTFIGMQRVHHQAERGIFVTTASFTKPARELAARHGITLVDGDELARLLVSGGRAKWAREESA
jgi:restriction system protein